MRSAELALGFDTATPIVPGSLRVRPERMRLGNVAIDTYSEASFLQEVVEHAMLGEDTRQVATVNAQFYVLAEHSLAFRECLRTAEYLCADGMPIVWACRLFSGVSVPRLAGVDLIDGLCRAGAPRGMRVFLLGGKVGTAEETGSILKERFPGLNVVGTSCPESGFEERPEALTALLGEIAAAEPQVIFVALGAPKQELFINAHLRGLRVPIAIGIGGSFEILSGRVQRAPGWMQSGGLEWLYRLSREPKRLWRRYLIGNTQFMWCLAKWRFRTELWDRPSERPHMSSN